MGRGLQTSWVLPAGTIRYCRDGTRRRKDRVPGVSGSFRTKTGRLVLGKEEVDKGSEILDPVHDRLLPGHAVSDLSHRSLHRFRHLFLDVRSGPPPSLGTTLGSQLTPGFGSRFQSRPSEDLPVLLYVSTLVGARVTWFRNDVIVRT